MIVHLQGRSNTETTLLLLIGSPFCRLLMSSALCNASQSCFACWGHTSEHASVQAWADLMRFSDLTDLGGILFGNVIHIAGSMLRVSFIRAASSALHPENTCGANAERCNDRPLPQGCDAICKKRTTFRLDMLMQPSAWDTRTGPCTMPGPHAPVLHECNADAGFSCLITE